MEHTEKMVICCFFFFASAFSLYHLFLVFPPGQKLIFKWHANNWQKNTKKISWFRWKFPCNILPYFSSEKKSRFNAPLQSINHHVFIYCLFIPQSHLRVDFKRIDHETFNWLVQIVFLGFITFILFFSSMFCFFFSCHRPFRSGFTHFHLDNRNFSLRRQTLELQVIWANRVHAALCVFAVYKTTP